MRRLHACLLLLVPTLAHATVTVTADTTAAPRFAVANTQVVCMIDCDDAGHLVRETLFGQRDWLADFGAENVRLEMDGGFAWDVMWNSWRSPGLTHNSDNPVLVDHRGFVYTGHDMQDDGLVIHLRDDDLQLEADVTWRLAEGDFFIRRLVTLRDPKERGHRLLRAFGRRGAIHNSSTLVKKGEYGQPVAFTVQDGGAFLGTEWPAATNTIVPAGCGAFKLECYEDLEMQISKAGASGAWTVAAVTPQPYVRLWFDRYLDDIRVAPVKPYLLYNSWYDLRSRDYVKEHLTGEERDVMTSANILRVARDFQTKFCEPYGIPLDAFVLDDGWDVYESDWQLRGPEFPGGLHPVDDELQKLGTTLGIWFGPTGGYSYRQRRIDWMQQHGYEVTANNMLCVGGAKYHDLLKRRNLDLIREHGVGYFKWDGVQFACNAEGHGHPIGLASPPRRPRERDRPLAHHARGEPRHLPQHHQRHLAVALVADDRQPDLDAGLRLRLRRRPLAHRPRRRHDLPRPRPLRRLRHPGLLVPPQQPDDPRHHQGLPRTPRRRDRPARQVHGRRRALLRARRLDVGAVRLAEPADGR